MVRSVVVFTAAFVWIVVFSRFRCLFVCDWLGCHVGVGPVEGVFLVCLVNIDRVLTPVDSASSLLRGFLFCCAFHLLSFVVDW